MSQPAGHEPSPEARHEANEATHGKRQETGLEQSSEAVHEKSPQQDHETTLEKGPKERHEKSPEERHEASLSVSHELRKPVRPAATHEVIQAVPLKTMSAPVAKSTVRRQLLFFFGTA